jgi:hypothetical protein
VTPEHFQAVDKAAGIALAIQDAPIRLADEGVVLWDVNQGA